MANGDPKILVVDNVAGDWRRIYCDGELIAENHPRRIDWLSALRAMDLNIVRETVPAFDLLGESIED